MADSPQSGWGGAAPAAGGSSPSGWGGSTPAATSAPRSGGGGGGFLHTVGKVLGTGADIVTLGGSGTLGVPTYIPTKVSPLGAGINLAKDVGDTAIQFGPGLVKFGGDFALAGYHSITHPLRPLTPENDPFTADLKGIGQQYKSFYYSPHVLSHLYEHPLQPLLDAATIADLGATGAVKLGQVGALGRYSDAAAGLADRADLVTRSPGAVFNQPDTRFVASPDGTIEPVDLGGGGPVHIAVSSTAPLAKLSQVAASRIRARFPEGAVRLGDTVIHPLPSEFRQYGKQVRHTAEQVSLEHLEPYRPYFQAVKRLTTSEWAALQIRAMDIHPSDLRILWHGTPDARWLTPKVRELVDAPSKRLQAAEAAARDLSHAGGDLLGPELSSEAADFRPILPKALAEAGLGRPPREIHGEPYYMPHVQEPAKGGASPLASRGGGKAPVRKLGSTKFNTGTLFAHGRLYLHGDVLGPEFLRRVKWRRYEAIHHALLSGSVRMTKDELREFGGLPKGWEYVREKPSTRIPFTLRGESEDEIMAHLVPNEHGTFKRGEQATGVYAGFTTTDPEEAFSVRRQMRDLDAHIKKLEGLLKAKHVPDRAPEVEKYIGVERKIARLKDELGQLQRAHGEAPLDEGSDVFHVIPSVTAKAATGEFTRTNQFVHAFLHKPLAVWRSIVLGLRVGFLTNNLVGNAIMYAVRTAGRGALRSLFGAILETHGYGVGRRILADKATPADLAAELEMAYPKLYHGTSRAFAEFDATHLDSDALYGPGIYLTDNPEVASGYAAAKLADDEVEHFKTPEEAQARFDELGRKGQGLRVKTGPVWEGGRYRQGARVLGYHVTIDRSAPNVRIVRARVRRPFDVRDEFTHAQAEKILGDRIDQAGVALKDYLGSQYVQANAAGKFTGDQVYVILSRLSPAAANARLAELGYDAIKHEGGLITGGASHEVTVVLDPAKVEPYFKPGAARPKSGLSPAFRSTPPAHEDFYAKHYPEQGRSATFGHTQSPALSSLTVAKNRATRVASDVTSAIPRATAKVAEEYPRRGLVRHFIRTSPEFRRIYKALPRQERTFLNAAKKLHSGEIEGFDSNAYRDRISQQVNGALGDYLHLSSFERTVMRNTFPFYSWYRAIVTTSAHLALEDPLRALILTKLAQIGQEWTEKELGQLPSFLRGVIPLGAGPGGTERVLSTSALNPYATLTQVGGGDVTSVGLSPFLLALLEEYARQAEHQHSSLPKVNIATELAKALESIVTGLPPAQIVAPTPPSKLYPYRNRLSTILGQTGVPVKDVDLAVAHQQAAEGR